MRERQAAGVDDRRAHGDREPGLPLDAEHRRPVQLGALNAASLLTGTHTVDVWYAGPGQVRIALPVSFGETDLRVNNRQVWLWDSHGQTATHYLLPALACSAAQLKMSKSAPTLADAARSPATDAPEEGDRARRDRALETFPARSTRSS